MLMMHIIAHFFPIFFNFQRSEDDEVDVQVQVQVEFTYLSVDGAE